MCAREWFRTGATGLWLLMWTAGAFPYESTLVGDLEAMAGHDSNPGNAALSSDARDDRFLDLTLRGNRLFTPGLHTSVELEAAAETVRYRRYDRLSLVGGRVLGRVNFRLPGGFLMPTASAWSSVGYRDYRSSLRDGARYRAGVSLWQPLAERLGVSVRIFRQWRRADNDVFQYRARTAELDFDWRPTEKLTAWAGVSLRSGGLVSSSADNASLKNAAPVWIEDDAFPGQASPQLAYRLDADTLGLALGTEFVVTEALLMGIELEHGRTEGSYGTGYRRTIAGVRLSWRPVQ